MPRISWLFIEFDERVQHWLVQITAVFEILLWNSNIHLVTERDIAWKMWLIDWPLCYTCLMKMLLYTRCFHTAQKPGRHFGVQTEDDPCPTDFAISSWSLAIFTSGILFLQLSSLCSSTDAYFNYKLLEKDLLESQYSFSHKPPSSVLNVEINDV